MDGSNPIYVKTDAIHIFTELYIVYVNSIDFTLSILSMYILDQTCHQFL
jgi:hypothetical protein